MISCTVNRLNYWHLILLFLLFVFNGFCVSCAATVVAKARDSIEPVVMTQIVTKAKDMGKLRAAKSVDYKLAT